MKAFWDSIVETRFFDRNGNPVKTVDEADVFVVRTDDRTWGSKWQAVSAINGHRVGSNEKELVKAKLWGLTQIASDDALAASIAITQGEPSRNSTRYQQKVIINGEHRATFVPHNYRQGYYLQDVTGETIMVHPDAYGYGRSPEVETKSAMIDMVMKWFEFIPSDTDIIARDKLRDEKEARHKAEVEAERVRHIKAQYANEMYDEIVEARDMLITDLYLNQPLSPAMKKAVMALHDKLSDTINTITHDINKGGE